LLFMSIFSRDPETAANHRLLAVAVVLLLAALPFLTGCGADSASAPEQTSASTGTGYAREGNVVKFEADEPPLQAMVEACDGYPVQQIETNVGSYMPDVVYVVCATDRGER
jgi:hypothetical protein